MACRDRGADVADRRVLLPARRQADVLRRSGGDDAHRRARRHLGRAVGERPAPADPRRAAAAAHRPLRHRARAIQLPLIAVSEV